MRCRLRTDPVYIFCWSLSARRRSRITNKPTTATAQKVKKSSRAELYRENLPEVSAGPVIVPGSPSPSRLAFSRPTLSALPRGDVQLVALITGKSFVDADDFDRLIHVGGPQIADCAGHVKYELPSALRGRQSLGRDKHFPGKQAMQEVIVKLGFVHMIDATEHGGTLRPARFKHHQSDSTAVRPVSPFAEKNPAQLRHGQLIHRIRLIDNDGQVPLRLRLFGCGELREPERASEQRSVQQGRTDQDDQNMCPAQHHYS